MGEAPGTSNISPAGDGRKHAGPLQSLLGGRWSVLPFAEVNYRPDAFHRRLKGGRHACDYKGAGVRREKAKANLGGGGLAWNFCGMPGFYLFFKLSF